MTTSTVTDKGQTTVPLEIRQALKVRPRQRLEWIDQGDGSAVVRPQGSALEFFGSLKSRTQFPGREAERKAVTRAIGREAAREGLK
jgi:bifunctional DNA-binding transcriptional regulator/antitoxin component of YhaV-PrlF toxin-antitoxin module